MHVGSSHPLFPSMFQSAPGLTVGRCRRPSYSTDPRSGFNPRPASRSGDAEGHNRDCAPAIVSIRARPHGRAMHRLRARPHALVRFNPRPASRSGDAIRLQSSSPVVNVSIRARPHGRAMRWMAIGSSSAGMFQSAPGLTVGRCRPGFAHDSGALGVSIRARPHGRAMPNADGWEVTVNNGFNPRPASRSGDALAPPRLRHLDRRFNPRPASRSGDAVHQSVGAPRSIGFNPRPASRSGDA